MMQVRFVSVRDAINHIDKMNMFFRTSVYKVTGGLYEWSDIKKANLKFLNWFWSKYYHSYYLDYVEVEDDEDE